MVNWPLFYLEGPGEESGGIISSVYRVLATVGFEGSL